MRQKENESINFSRVESIEVIKLTDTERIKELCPSGYVYDLEIEGNNNYLAEDILVHNCSAYPKPSKRAVQVKDLIKKTKANVILLSGTPTPESYSQMYHQVYGIPKNPFKEFSNFYKFCNTFVKVKAKMINGLIIKDYSEGLDTIVEAMAPFTINYTQQEAGFVTETTEEVFEVELKE